MYEIYRQKLLKQRDKFEHLKKIYDDWKKHRKLQEKETLLPELHNSPKGFPDDFSTTKFIIREPVLKIFEEFENLDKRYQQFGKYIVIKLVLLYSRAWKSR